jgi:hypothetical protein
MNHQRPEGLCRGASRPGCGGKDQGSSALPDADFSKQVLAITAISSVDIDHFSQICCGGDGIQFTDRAPSQRPGLAKNPCRVEMRGPNSPQDP